MGVKLHTQDNPKSQFLQSMNFVLHVICQRMKNIWEHSDWLFKFTSHYATYEKAKKTLYEVTDQVRSLYDDKVQYPKLVLLLLVC